MSALVAQVQRGSVETLFDCLLAAQGRDDGKDGEAETEAKAKAGVRVLAELATRMLCRHRALAKEPPPPAPPAEPEQTAVEEWPEEG